MPSPEDTVAEVPNGEIMQKLLGEMGRTDQLEPQMRPIDKTEDIGADVVAGQLSPEFLASIAADFPERPPVVSEPEATQMPIDMSNPGPAAQPPEGAVQRVEIPAPLLLALVEHGLAAQEEFAQQLGLGLGALIDFHINRAVLLIAGVDSPIVRGQIIENLVTRLPAEIDRAYLRLHQTKAGLVIPPNGMALPPAPAAA